MYLVFKLSDGNSKIGSYNILDFVISSALHMLFSYDSKYFYSGAMDWIIPQAAVLCEDS